MITLCMMLGLGSPIIFIIGYPIGIWARVSHLAPRLGLTIIVQTTLLLATLIGVIIWFSIFPPPLQIDPDRNLPLIAYFYTAGPQSLLAFTIIFITIGVMIREKMKRSEQAVAGYGPQVVAMQSFSLAARLPSTDRGPSPEP